MCIGIDGKHICYARAEVHCKERSAQDKRVDHHALFQNTAHVDPLIFDPGTNFIPQKKVWSTPFLILVVRGLDRTCGEMWARPPACLGSPGTRVSWLFAPQGSCEERVRALAAAAGNDNTRGGGSGATCEQPVRSFITSSILSTSGTTLRSVFENSPRKRSSACSLLGKRGAHKKGVDHVHLVTSILKSHDR